MLSTTALTTLSVSRKETYKPTIQTFPRDGAKGSCKRHLMFNVRFRRGGRRFRTTVFIISDRATTSTMALYFDTRALKLYDCHNEKGDQYYARPCGGSSVSLFPRQLPK